MASVTIVIPVFNRAAYLSRLFRSLEAVDYEDLEVLLVDNCSTDNSLSLCRSFAEDAPMIVRILQEPRPGACYARNLGLEACKTEWIYFFDSDDELSPTFLEEILPQGNDYDLIAFPTRQEENGTTRIRAFCPSPKAASQILSATLSTQSMIFRTDFLRRIGGWDVRLSVWQDWELGIRALLAEPRILWLGENAYHTIYIHPDSLTGPSMYSRMEARLEAVRIAEAQLKTAADIRALYLRRRILNGMLQREVVSPLPPTPHVAAALRLYGDLLQTYVAHGGRGAWRLAKMVC